MVDGSGNKREVYLLRLCALAGTVGFGVYFVRGLHYYASVFDWHSHRFPPDVATEDLVACALLGIFFFFSGATYILTVRWSRERFSGPKR
jgi:hypothetical protein